RVPAPPDTFAQHHSVPLGTFQRDLPAARAALLAARDQRRRPHRDEKILTAWNGLMISTLASAAGPLNDPTLAAAAVQAADFILTHVQRNGRLLRSYRTSASPVPGFLDDYAYFVAAMIDVYEATFDVRWLAEANRLSDAM